MKKPNIVFITTDQQRFDTIQGLGNGTIFTPHLNYLMSQGITYTRCYADCPVCVPSRTSYMLGKNATTTGIKGNQDHSKVMTENITLPQILVNHGYQTKAVGKMHFEPARAKYGFEHTEISIDYMRKYDKMGEDKKPKAHGLGECLIEPVISTVHENDSQTHWVIERSIDFLETKDPTKPFFLWTSFSKPHPPFDPCLNYWMLYENEEMEAPIYGDWSKDIEDIPQGFLLSTYSNTNMFQYKEKQIKKIRRAYYAMITQIDYSIGRLMAYLREMGLLSNTWIVFASDHGEMLGDHHMGQKSNFFEGAAHIPMMVVPPQGTDLTQCGKLVEKLTTTSDVFPTVLDIVGIDGSDLGLDGKSLLTVDNEEERDFYGVCRDLTFCYMKDNIKYMFTRYGGEELLFDLNVDPNERKNVIDAPEYQSRLIQYRKALIDNIKKSSPDILDGENIITLPLMCSNDIKQRWFGFHIKDYSVDTFH